MRIKKMASVFEIISKHAAVFNSFSFGFFDHLPDQNTMFRLGKSWMNN